MVLKNWGQRRSCHCCHMLPEPDGSPKGRLITVTREELHAMIWKEPITKVAQRFGLSDVALRKKCVRHSVPVPTRGFWRKMETGGNPRPMALAPVVDSKGIEFWLPPDGVGGSMPPEVAPTLGASRAVLTRADYRRDGLRKQEERRQRLEALEQENAAARGRVAAERKAVARLEADALAWERAERLRAYIAAAAASPTLDWSADERGRWVEWALGQANVIDPLFSRRSPFAEQCPT